MDQDNGIRLKNAQWFAKELGNFSYENQARLIHSKDIGDFQQIYGPGAERLWNAREDWRTEISLGNRVDIAHPRKMNSSSSGEQELTSAASGAASFAGVGVLGGIGAVGYIRNRKYNKFKKSAEKIAKEKAAEWEKNPDPTYAKSKESAFKRALNEHHEEFLEQNPDLARKWAKQHNDDNLNKAIKRKEILDKPNPRRDKKELDEFLKRNEIFYPIKKHSPEESIAPEEASRRLEAAAAVGATKTVTPEATADSLERLQKETLSRQNENNKNELIMPFSPKPSTQTQTQTQPYIASHPALRTSSPQAPRQVPGRFSYLLRRGQRANRRYGAGGFAKSIGKNAAKKGAKRTAGWGLSWLLANPYVIAAIIVVVLIFLLYVIIMARICELTNGLPFRETWAPYLHEHCGETTQTQGVPPPPEGYTIVKTGPVSVNNGENINYKIIVTYDPAKATYKPDQLTLWDTPSYPFTIIESSTTNPKTVETIGTGQAVAWKLSDFFSLSGSEIQEKTFNLELKPSVENEQVENSAYIPSLGGGRLPPKPSIDQFMKWFNVYLCQGSISTNSSASPSGCSQQGADSVYTKFAYDVYSEPLRSQRFLSLLKVENRKINIRFGTVDLGRCHISGGGSYSAAPDDLRLDGYYDYFKNSCGIIYKWSMIHEAGHILQNRNLTGVYADFKVGRLSSEDGTGCYEEGSDGPYIKTYAYRCPQGGGCAYDGGGGSKEESFGEAIGMNVVCGPDTTCDKGIYASKPITNYPAKCEATYEWVKDNIYGGVDYFGLGGTGAIGDLAEGKNEPPSNRTCNGKWTDIMYGDDGIPNRDGGNNVSNYLGGRVNVNFGDPVCTYTKPKWNAYLEKTETKTNLWEFWKDIAITEGSINSGNSSGWGKFQMNPGSPIFAQPQVGAIRGDVTWQRQIEIAVARNNFLDTELNWRFGFWGTAYCLCYFDYYRNNNAWCGDLIRKGDVRCPNYCHANSCSTRTDSVGIDKNNGRQGCNDYRCQIGTTPLYDN